MTHGGPVASVAVSTVIFTLLPRSDALHLHLPVVRRTRDPFDGAWALPGGWIGADEDLADAARRTLVETTGLRPSYVEQLYTFGRADRSPTGRVVSVIYSALVRSPEAARVAEVHNVRWVPVAEASGLAFDHDEVVAYALWRLRAKVGYAQVAVHLLGETFSLGQLREVHEAVLGRELDPANFRRRVVASGAVEATDEHLTGGRHRPPRLYRAVVPEGAAGPFETTAGPAA
ncbi:NUDIX domain-containing protein [Pseudokineococcus basanitobsidens]|uniref:NUDIX domain-containing protein n=1 Tax=Pseudokineococcus basanitobsidens TaxID=1926649 RepID=A0ABU8RK83_9ACTN